MGTANCNAFKHSAFSDKGQNRIKCYCPSSVHGFERTVVLVDEGTSGEIVFRVNIKGNALAEDSHFRDTEFVWTTLYCHDVTTGE